MDIAIQAAKKAGKKLMSMQQGIDVQTKKDGSPVTAADRAASTMIGQALSKTGIPVLDEETFSETPTANKMWIVDPLDGTSEFIKGSDEYTVNIALVENGVVQFGVVHAPRLNATYWGGIIQPSMKEQDGVQKKITVSDSSLVGAVSVSHPDERVNKVYEALGITEEASVGSSLKGCYVAEGRIGVYVRYHKLYEWDVCAMHAVLEGAGAVFSYLDGERVVYGKSNPRMKPFICSRASLAQKALTFKE